MLVSLIKLHPELDVILKRG